MDLLSIDVIETIARHCDWLETKLFVLSINRNAHKTLHKQRTSAMRCERFDIAKALVSGHVRDLPHRICSRGNEVDCVVSNGRYHLIISKDWRHGSHSSLTCLRRISRIDTEGDCIIFNTSPCDPGIYYRLNDTEVTYIGLCRTFTAMVTPGMRMALCMDYKKASSASRQRCVSPFAT